MRSWQVFPRLVLALTLAPGTFTGSGFPDISFGGSGIVTTPPGLQAIERAQAKSVLVQPDGKIVAAGDATVGAVAGFAVVRYDADGALDPAVGGGALARRAATPGGATAAPRSRP